MPWIPLEHLQLIIKLRNVEVLSKRAPQIIVSPVVWSKKILGPIWFGAWPQINPSWHHLYISTLFRINDRAGGKIGNSTLWGKPCTPCFPPRSEGHSLAVETKAYYSCMAINSDLFLFYLKSDITNILWRLPVFGSLCLNIPGNVFLSKSLPIFIGNIS